MILAALILIALLAVALAASVAFIRHALALEQHDRREVPKTRVPLAA